MLQTSTIKAHSTPARCRPAPDYDLVRRAVAFISEHWRGQPEVEEIAEAVGVTPTELHHLFRRWAGLTPKAFVAALTLDHARAGCCAIPRACSMLPTKSGCPDPAGCTIFS